MSHAPVVVARTSPDVTVQLQCGVTTLTNQELWIKDKIIHKNKTFKYKIKEEDNIVMRCEYMPRIDLDVEMAGWCP